MEANAKRHDPDGPDNLPGADDKCVNIGERGFSRLTILSMVVVLMATWEAISSTMVSGLISGGPVSLVYGYLLAACGAAVTAASLAEMASMYPTAGGQYHYIAKLAPERLRDILSCAPFLAATMIQGLLVLNYETYEFQRWHGTMLYWALTALATIINVWGSQLMSLVEGASFFIHVLAFIGNFVAIWVCSPTRHSAGFVFTFFQNNTGWSDNGVPWCIGMLSSCYVLVGYDGAIHMGEEMLHPEVSVPHCMLGSIAINGTLGFAFLLTLLFCMGDMNTALNSSTGFPFIEIFKNATGGAAASSAMTSTLIAMAGLATIPLMASTARMVWSLARDQAVPFSGYLSKVNSRTELPTRAVLATSAIMVLLGLVNVGSTTAFNAIISLAIFGLHISYLVPIGFLLWRRLATPGVLAYGPWKLGRFGVATNIISLVYLTYTSVFMVFPPYQPVTPVNMNYACLIFGAVLIFSAIYWVYKGRKVYEGPNIGSYGM
ncbi:putative GABA permease [Aspergillus ambiguus]|uniref:putative GABA permease n=1 Tax=Aspergillus ambiguus TaxID=176160 RepID=UPI003CCE1745